MVQNSDQSTNRRQALWAQRTAEVGRDFSQTSSPPTCSKCQLEQVGPGAS